MNYIKITYRDSIYPQRLLKIKNYPKELYIAGNYELLNKEKNVAIIGSRDSTTYGRKNAETFSKELSQKDICIVSGMAIGIDTCAHIGAVENKRKDNSSARAEDLIKYIHKKMNGYSTKY